ncbi:MAG: Holliday junction DNA helicase RuvA [Chloroflexi bacterium]|nr:Holliday junction DNA helicase RuvA [Chloroflexota bacterium]
MIAALRGELVRWDPERSTLWIDAAGVTYEVYMPAFAADWAASHAEGEEVRVFTYHHATERQPVPTLYGFAHLAEREFFRKFIDVPDMGPAKAVRALTYPISEIAGWIEAEDQRSLRQLPGIGERLSQTVIAHLHGKLVQEALLRDALDADGTGPTADVRDDAVDALVALQYPRREAQRVVAAALAEEPDLVTLEDVLRYVLERRGGA